MDWDRLDKTTLDALDRVLGYLNLSGGSEDHGFLRSLNRLCEWLDEREPTTQDRPPWRSLHELLQRRLRYLEGAQRAFQPCDQAKAVLQLLAELVAAYLDFHRLLLFHQTEAQLLNPFLVGRFFEALLRQGPPWDDHPRIVEGALNRLNDFVGHRPVPNLEGHVTRAYAHEFVRPVPIYIQGVGAAHGPYRALVERLLEILAATPERLLESVQFDIRQLRELAFDPRAYDFDHPVHRRPGYQFGEWDPHAIDESNQYDRFVVRQEMLNIVLLRVNQAQNATDRQERLTEAAAVTAGSLLVAAGMSGRGPEAHDSNATFGTIVPHLGRCRDAFYVDLLQRMDGEQVVRLRRQAEKDGQPFNEVRQDLNQALSRRNAIQKIRLKLAEVFAHMGHADRAQQQLSEVSVVSAHVRGDLTCMLIGVTEALAGGRWGDAHTELQSVVARLREGIECGALVDPRCILGFDCQFSLFPAVENSIFDHRIETLLEIVHEIFRLAARVWSEAAARNDSVGAIQAETQLRDFAEWWHTFAAHEVQSVDGESALQRLVAAQNVAEVVRRWVQAGSASGAVAFWAPHAEMFRSPQAYVQVIDVLLQHQDHVASMGLLMHWLGNENVPLERSEASFGQLAHQWLSETLRYAGRDGSHDDTEPPDLENTNWELVAKFFDYLEANSGEYWIPPALVDEELLDDEVEAAHEPWLQDEDLLEEENENDGLFAAAYEDVVYQDSTDDGVEGPIFESAQEDDNHFDREAERLASRLLFLYRVAGLWKTACMACVAARQQGQRLDTNPIPARFHGWIQNSTVMRRGLRDLTAQLRRWRLPGVSDDAESLSRYDHRRAVRDSLLEQSVATITALREAELLLRSCDEEPLTKIRATDSSGFPKRDAVQCLRAIFMPGMATDITLALDKLLQRLRGRHLIHIAIYRGGSCKQSVTAHISHAFLRTLVWHLPRMGRTGDACRLLETLRRREGRAMGRAHTISHFNRLFELACRSIFETTARAAQSELPCDPTELCEKIETIAETLLIPWVRYSRSLRLSVVERFLPKSEWDHTRQFIENYGADLFTKDKLDLGLLRGLIYQGVHQWLLRMDASLEEEDLPKLLREVKSPEARRAAARTLNAILETLAENFDEYSEFHATTSKADRGELCYVLLDFLRLRCEYRRVAWNLWPFGLAHAAIVRAGIPDVAELWEARLWDRVRERAEHFMQRLEAMEERYGVSLPSVREAISEKFVRPMQVNQLLGDAHLAMHGSGPETEATQSAFSRLAARSETFLRDVSGAHRGMPDWLDRLSRLVQPSEPHASADLAVSDVGNMPRIPPPPLDEIVKQVLAWRESMQSFPPHERPS